MRNRMRFKDLATDDTFADHAAIYAQRMIRCVDELAATASDRYTLAEYLFAIVRRDETTECPQTLREVKHEAAGLALEVKSAPVAVANNVEFLVDSLRLTSAETALLELALVLAYQGSLLAVFQRIQPQTRPNAARKLATVVGHDVRDIASAISPRATLIRLGLFKPYEAKDSLDTAVELPNDVLLALTDEYGEPSQLLESFVNTCPPSNLTPGHFPHLAKDLDWLTRYLAEALAQRRVGVNCFLWGAPGTGKTAFAHLIAKQLGVRLFEISYEDREAKPSDAAGRLRSFQLAQACFARGGGVLTLFDEAEDVFPGVGPFGSSQSSEAYGKAWMNRLLESNPVPCLWISNTVEDIDLAFRRRFDYSLAFEIPPLAVRQHLVNELCTGVGMPPEALARLADEDRVSPGQIARAAATARVVGAAGADAGAFVIRNVQHSSRLLGHGDVLAPQPDVAVALDPGLMNTTLDASTLVEQLARREAPAAAILLYGPSGCGKTALARHIAVRLGRPLLLRGSADVLRAYVGETEQCIDEMFQRAATERAVLFLDEADSLLATRERARHQYETTRVNQMLMRIESFTGIFVAATNVLDALDPASLRRFTVKIGFDYLQLSQRVRMAKLVLGLDTDRSDDDLIAALKPLRLLTPGDFVVVAKQAALLAETLTVASLIEGLHKELAVKGAVRPNIGFTPSLH